MLITFRKNHLMKNKKADVSITLLVLMTVVLCAASLVILVFSNINIEKKISNINVVNEFYSERQIFEFYLYSLAYSIFLENPSKTPEQFITKFKEAYKYNSPKEYLDDYLKNQVESNEKYEVKIENNVLKFRLKDFKFIKKPGLEKGQEVVYIEHVKDITFEINLKTQVS